MPVLDSNEFGALSEPRLQAFEAQLGVSLPADYRAWLLAHNGGRLEPATFLISAAEGPSVFHHALGLHDGPEYARLDVNHATLAGRLPRALLAVGDDVFGNAVCVGLAGPARGQVFFWDHEREEEPTALTPIAASWTAFLAGLYDEPEDEVADAP